MKSAKTHGFFCVDLLGTDLLAIYPSRNESCNATPLAVLSCDRGINRRKWYYDTRNGECDKMLYNPDCAATTNVFNDEAECMAAWYGLGNIPIKRISCNFFL